MAIKETKEERKARRERREQIWQVMNGLNLGSLADVQEFFKEMVGTVLEKGLEAELDDELGYTKYDYRNKDKTETNSRNGHSIKTLKTSNGDLAMGVR